MCYRGFHPWSFRDVMLIEIGRFRCSRDGTGCTALTGTTSSSSSSGIDTTRKNKSTGIQLTTGSGAAGTVKIAGGLGAVLAVAVAVAM